MSAVNEDIVERDIDRAVAASRKADCNLWVAGFFAARVVGMYQNNAVIEIGLRAGKSVASVQNWAHAWEMYNELRLTDACRARKLRRRLSPSHFWTAWEKRNKYGYSLKKVLHYFGQVLDHKKNGEPHGADALAREIEAEENQLGTVPGWNWYAPRLNRLYVSLLVLSDLPNDARAWLAAAG